MDPTPLPVSMGVQTRRSSITLELADRLSNLDNPHAQDTAEKMRLCGILMRCGKSACASCAARASKKLRRSIERNIAALPKGFDIAQLTITTGSDTIDQGRSAIVESLPVLRRRRVFCPILAGRGQIEFKPAVGMSRAWNVHAHIVVTFATPMRCSVSDLRIEWNDILEARGLPAQLDWQTRTTRFVPGRHGGLFAPAAFYAVCRARSEWLAYTDAELNEAFEATRGQRFAINFGHWPTTAKQGGTEHEATHHTSE